MNLTTQQKKVLEALAGGRSACYHLSRALGWSRINTSLVLQQLKRRGKVKCDRQIWEIEP